MGPSTDPMAVLDSKARVYGVSNLRVVDSSSFPTLPPGHPMSTICKFLLEPYQIPPNSNILTLDALAEKIADDIKNENWDILREP
jgi:choline dehydrogenase